LRFSKYYHEDFLKSSQASLNPNEQFLDAANQSFGQKLSRGADRFMGYLIVTSRRLIRFDFKIGERLLFSNRKSIRMNKDYFAFDIPKSPLTRKEKDSRRVQEVMIEDIKWIHRSEFPVNIRGEDVTIVDVEYSYLNSLFIIGANEGNRVYETLWWLIQKRKEKPGMICNSNNQLEQLTELKQKMADTF